MPEAGTPTTQAVITIGFAKSPAPDTRAKLKNAGFEYDNITQTWTAPATPRARELAERYRPYLATDAPAVPPATAPAPATPPARPLATRAATGAQGAAPEPAPILPSTPAHLQPVLDWIRDHIRPQSYATWFAPSALAGDAQRLEVLTVSPIIAGHIEDCHLDAIREACGATLGWVPARIECRVPGAPAPARASPPGGPPSAPATEPAAEPEAH